MPHIDLNLIRTFVTLYHTRSVTAAAERLHVTQPSVSYALSRLRVLLNDPLFTRTRNGMAPTFAATQFYATFQEALARIENAIDSHHHFDPARSEKRFRLALTDLGEMSLLPSIMQALHAQAPLIELEVWPLEIDKVTQWLATGKIDAMICSRPITGPGVERRVIVCERYVCLLNRDHTTIGDHLSLEQFVAQKHAVVAPTAGHGLAEEVLSEMGIQRKISLVVPHFSILPRLIEGTDLLVILPVQIATSFAAQARLKVLELPFAVPTFEVALYWQTHGGDSAPQRWFCDSIIKAVASNTADLT
ncbi:LysR family transcriptional regulator [Phytohalomonas tamaricis]|uniref:LysR family transcriptional regulator n=1 Tax=Phytohalomonas tamaricis TaxID=2081032 RepID=UPI000D0B700D|nr:LysR family transcriptional regulator [Phytohalomonas tamaricis]